MRYHLKYRMTDAELAVLVRIIKTEEGFSSKPYWDISHYTVGYGHAIEASHFQITVSESEAQRLLIEDVVKARAATERVLRSLGFNYLKLNSARFATLTEMMFQMGHLRFPKMLGAIRVGNWYNAAMEVITTNNQLTASKLYRQVPKRALRYAHQMYLGMFFEAYK